MNLNQLAGVISDVQHGSKTSIPDAHHQRQHTHYIPKNEWSKEETTETSTSSTSYETLIETIAEPLLGITPCSLCFFFSHNVKNEGTLSSRGADFKLYGEDELGEFEISGAEFRWTDGLADYKLMTAFLVHLMGDCFGDVKWEVKWKVDNASYPCWSKNRFFAVHSWDFGGDVMTEG